MLLIFLYLFLYLQPKNSPWIQILTSFPVWAIVITHGASVFGYFTIVNQLPTYMKYLLHYDIKSVYIYYILYMIKYKYDVLFLIFIFNLRYY